MKRSATLAFLLTLMFVVSGCSSGKDIQKAVENIRTGTDGISISFLPYNPPNVVHVEQNNEKNLFDVILEVKNKEIGRAHV